MNKIIWKDGNYLNMGKSDKGLEFMVTDCGGYVYYFIYHKNALIKKDKVNDLPEKLELRKFLKDDAKAICEKFNNNFTFSE